MKKAGVADPKDYIHRQIARIDNAKHTNVHERGWNRDFNNWYKNNQNFTRKDLQRQIKTMMKNYNVPGSSRNFAGRYTS